MSIRNIHLACDDMCSFRPSPHKKRSKKRLLCVRPSIWWQISRSCEQCLSSNTLCLPFPFLLLLLLSLFVTESWVYGQLSSLCGPAELTLVPSELPLSIHLPTSEGWTAVLAVSLWFLVPTTGFEPTRGDPIRFETLGRSHSATSTLHDDPTS